MNSDEVQFRVCVLQYPTHTNSFASVNFRMNFIKSRNYLPCSGDDGIKFGNMNMSWAKNYAQYVRNVCS